MLAGGEDKTAEWDETASSYRGVASGEGQGCLVLLLLRGPPSPPPPPILLARIAFTKITSHSFSAAHSLPPPLPI